MHNQAGSLEKKSNGLLHQGAALQTVKHTNAGTAFGKMLLADLQTTGKIIKHLHLGCTLCCIP